MEPACCNRLSSLFPGHPALLYSATCLPCLQQRAGLQTVFDTMKKILIIERNTGSIQISQQLLVEEGYAVLILSSAIKLLKYEFEQPDIIIINSRLFNMTSAEICHHLQLRDSLRDVPVILAYNIGDEARLPEHCDVAAVLEKPFLSEDLLMLVKRFIG